MFDIVVIGAGPVGATLALALADADLNLVLVDSRAHDEAGRSERTLALSHGARLIFERVGIWGPLAATRNAVTPIVEVDVSQAQAFGATRLTAADAGVPALGYVVSYRALQAALGETWEALGAARRVPAESWHVTTAFLAWVCEQVAAQGKTVLALIWDNASWHISKQVRSWIREHNRQAKRGGGVRILVCRLPVKSPWLNRIEPHWVHAKRAIVEPDRTLTKAELIERICAYFNCTYVAHLQQTIAHKVA